MLSSIALSFREAWVAEHWSGHAVALALGIAFHKPLRQSLTLEWRQLSHVFVRLAFGKHLHWLATKPRGKGRVVLQGSREVLVETVSERAGFLAPRLCVVTPLI